MIYEIAKKYADKLKGTTLSEGSSKKKQSGGLQSKTTDELPVSKLYIFVRLIRKERSIYMLIHFMYKRSMLEKWHQEQWLAHLSNTSLFKKCRTRKCVCSANLKPAAMCGVKSHAMVLAASNEDHTKVEMPGSPKSAVVGR